MINTLGNNQVVVDSDALIGLMNETDALHLRSLRIYQYLNGKKFVVLVPYPIVLEAATTLARDRTIRRPDLASRLLQKYATSDHGLISNQSIPKLVAQLYKPKTSKKNSPFDYFLLAAAKQNNIRLVFSFDTFYEKNGLTLIEDLVK